MKKYNFSKFTVNSVIVALMLTGFTTIYAQQEKHEFSLYAGGVFSSIYYDLENGQADHEHGVQLGLKYSYYLNDSWSIGVGAEYQTYNTKAQFDYVSGNYDAVDFENDPFEFRYDMKGYRENQKLHYVNIPVTIQFETGDGITDFYIAAGAKVGFAVKGEYETGINSLSTSGYYPQYNAELFGPAFMGFDSFYDVKTGKQELKTKIAWSGTLESGVKQYIGEHNSFYIGLFVDYCFNAVADNKKENIVDYPSDEMPVSLHYNSVINSSYSKDVRLIGYGAKLRFAFF